MQQYMRAILKMDYIFQFLNWSKQRQSAPVEKHFDFICE